MLDRSHETFQLHPDGGRAARSLSSWPFKKRDGQPIYMQARCVDGFAKEAVRDYAKAAIVPGSRVLSDGLGCWNGLGEVGKSAMTDTCRSCDQRHTPRYLAAYEWYFNRRFNLPANLARLARVATATAPENA